jgi:hypothetical protein
MMTKEQVLAAFAKAGCVDWYGDTPFVACDEPCFALREPITFDEVRAALTHWQSHRYFGGCSHGR